MPGLPDEVKLRCDKPSVADHSALLTGPFLMERAIYTKLIFKHQLNFER